MVKEDGSDIVEVTVQGEETPSCLIRPDLDLVVVTTRDEKRLGGMEIYSSYRPVMLLEAIDQCPHAIVPQLNSGRVQRY